MMCCLVSWFCEIYNTTTTRG